jgi:hypothetical protein
VNSTIRWLSNVRGLGDKNCHTKEKRYGPRTLNYYYCSLACRCGSKVERERWVTNAIADLIESNHHENVDPIVDLFCESDPAIEL